MATLNTHNSIGATYFLAIGPQYNFDYHDAEPSISPVQSAQVQGCVTGVPKLGSAFYLAFVDEEVDARWFGATSVINDWGDGTPFDGTGSYTHTYSAVGGYWVTNKASSGGPAFATRFVRVIYRPGSRPPFGSFNPFDVSYPCSIDGETEGSVEASFALKFTLQLDSLDYPNSALGVLYDRMMVGIFCVDITNDTSFSQGTIKLVAGGFLAQPQLRPQSSGRTISFIAYGPCFWLLNSYMREQQYIDSGEIGISTVAISANVEINGGSPLFSDVFGLGYVPNHWIKVQPTIAAMHVLQHVRVYASTNGDPSTPSSPNMAQSKNSYSYGTLGQFLDINTDSDFNETAGRITAGFHAFSVSDGQVLGNIRQLIDNEGFRYYDRHDLTQRFERKPYYRASQPAATLTVTDITKLMNGYEIDKGIERPVRQIIVEKPLLATLSDATNTTPSTVSGVTAYPRDPGDMLDTVFITDPYMKQAYSNVWNASDASGQAGVKSLTEDGSQNSLDLSTFYSYWPATPRAFGRTIGPLRNVFTLNPQDYAKGRDKEERARYSVKLPLGMVFGIGLGDLVALSHADSVYNIAWSGKLFDIISMSMDTRPGRYGVIVEAAEAEPD